MNSSDPHAHYRTRGTPATTTPSPRRTPPLAAKYPNGVYITPQGFPDFSPYAVATVRLDQIGPTRPGDFARANAQAGIPRTPRGWVWHHVEDAHTLHLIPRDLHIEVSHHGGWSRMINVLMKGTT
ncbi:HNH endonuclease [Rhodococcus triatomae]|uniref:HNH endonuclease n=1 Tax=Rhodococcus triatomae TaxID=300028 RepID=UPI003CCD9BA8